MKNQPPRSLGKDLGLAVLKWAFIWVAINILWGIGLGIMIAAGEVDPHNLPGIPRVLWILSMILILRFLQPHNRARLWRKVGMKQNQVPQQHSSHPGQGMPSQPANPKMEIRLAGALLLFILVQVVFTIL